MNADRKAEAALADDLADDLTAIIAAVQDGHVDVDNPDDVIAACDLSLWELQIGGAA